MFDNDQASLERSYDSMQPFLSARERCRPYTSRASISSTTSCLHAFIGGEALPESKAVLVEFGSLPRRLQQRFFDLRRAGLVPVIADPERYEAVWRDDGCLDPLLDAGAHLLLDLCALVGKYGRLPQRAAEKLLEEDAYEAACSDAHKTG